MRSKRRRPEDIIHRAVAGHLRSRAADGVVWWHTPNGGKRSPIEAANFKRLGVLAGFPDFAALYKNNFYAMELKSEDGRPTTSQLEVIARLNEQGAYTAIVYGLDPALRVLEAWGLLKGRSA